MGVRRTYRRHSGPVLRTRRWKTLRWQIMERDGFKCLSCGKGGRLEVDHIKPVRDAPERAFDPGNLQTLCPSCHTAKTRIECGHPPPDPRRAAWSALVEDLEPKSNKERKRCSIL